MSLNEVIKTANISKKCLMNIKKVFETRIILTNNEIKDIIKVIKSVENSVILLKGLLLGRLDASLLGDLLPGKDTIRACKGEIAASHGRGKIRAGKVTIRAGQDF